jgi:hypothetical protein
VHKYKILTSSVPIKCTNTHTRLICIQKILACGKIPYFNLCIAAASHRIYSNQSRRDGFQKNSFLVSTWHKLIFVRSRFEISPRRSEPTKSLGCRRGIQNATGHSPRAHIIIFLCVGCWLCSAQLSRWTQSQTHRPTDRRTLFHFTSDEKNDLIKVNAFLITRLICRSLYFGWPINKISSGRGGAAPGAPDTHTHTILFLV